MSAKSKQSKQLVVDASIAQSAGGAGATDSRATHCRDFLQAILRICHRMLFSQDIKAEWDEHQSGFARSWRVSMVAKKKLIIADVPHDETLRTQIDEATEQDHLKAAAEKDIHLLEGALAGDGIVASLDDNAREIFHDACTAAPSLRNIAWFNPDTLADESTAWLEDGAPKDKRLLLTSDTPKKSDKS